MKHTLMFALSTLLFSMTVHAADAPPQDKQTEIGINNVFVPEGLNSQSESRVVVSGLFQNGCYHWSHAEVIDRTPFAHDVRIFAGVTPGMCIMVLVPFQKDLRLGVLASGNHTLNFINGESTYMEQSVVIP